MSNLRRTLTVFALAAAIAAGVGRARAQDERTARLEYDAPAVCPDADHARDAIAARLERARLVDDPEANVLHVVIVARGRELVGTVQIDGRSHELRSTECNDLVDALAVAIGVALGSPAEPLPPEPAVPPEPVVVSDPERPPGSAPPAEPSGAARETEPEPEPEEAADRVRMRAVASFALAFGVGPAATLGGQLEIGIDWAWLGVALEGRAETTPGAHTTESGDQIRVGFLALGVVPCARVSLLRACIGATFGALEAEAENVTDPMPKWIFAAAVLARAGIEWTTGPLVLHAAVEGDVWLTRTSLYVGSHVAWATPPVAFRLILGAGVLLP